jgi:hypothetical protein
MAPLGAVLPAPSSNLCLSEFQAWEPHPPQCLRVPPPCARSMRRFHIALCCLQQRADIQERRDTACKVMVER